MSASPDALLRAPLFVLGCPRSGTTFVGEMLGAHPRIAYWNEPPEIMAYAPRVFRGEVSADEARAFYHAVYRRWLAGRPLARAARFAEKCPRHALVLPFLAGAFPGARFLHVLRDGRAVASSLVRTGWLAESGEAPGGNRARYWVPAAERARFEAATEAERAALTWEAFVRAGLEGRRVAPDRYFEVRYEDLLADPQAWARRLLAFAGVELDRAVVRFVERARRDRDAAWTRELAGDDRAAVERLAGGLLRELGYDGAGAV